MSYLGNSPPSQNFVAGADQFSGTGSQLAFTLSRNVNTVFDMFVTVSNVPQDPFTAYTVAGNTLTFDSAPPSGTNNIDVVYRATNVQTFVPSPGVSQQFSIGTAASPAITFIGDTNTGIYSPGADTLAFVEGGTEAMRIDSSANVGIGTTSPAANNRMTLNASSGNNGFEIQNSGDSNRGGRLVATGSAASGTFAVNTTSSGYALTFGIDAIERARINSSGQFFIGNTTGVSSGGRAQVVQTDQGNAALSVDATNASFDYNVLFLNTTRAASSAFDYIQCDSGGYAAAQFRVRGDGVIFAQNTTVQSISDARTKENVRDANEGLDTILGLRPVRFDFKEGFGNNRKNQLGFIAQEVEPIFPDAVDVVKELDENGESYKSVGPSAMIPVLVKAIQELKAEVDQLRAQLEAK